MERGRCHPVLLGINSVSVPQLGLPKSRYDRRIAIGGKGFCFFAHGVSRHALSAG